MPRFNPWWGCTRVSEACNHCYAESWAARFGTGWGKNAERRMFGDKHWNEPLAWNRKAEAAGTPKLVFCASMADVFEDHDGLDEQRERLWDLIARTPWLTWQLLTKRPENIASMVPDAWYAPGAWPLNVWAGTTIETQRRAEERLPILLGVPAPVRFVSCEPLFGKVDLGMGVDHRPHERDHITTDQGWQCLDCSTDDETVGWTYPDGPNIDWVIAGGESGQKARPSHPDWFRSLRDQAASARVPFLFKQWGEWGPAGAWPGPDHHITPDGKLWAPGEPCGSVAAAIHRWGKREAGWVLDGRTHDQIPEPRVAWSA